MRAELIRLLTKDNEPIAPETPAMPIPAATEAEGNGVDVNTSAETMKSAFAELAADLTDALSGPPKRARVVGRRGARTSRRQPVGCHENSD